MPPSLSHMIALIEPSLKPSPLLREEQSLPSRTSPSMPSALSLPTTTRPPQLLATLLHPAAPPQLTIPMQLTTPPLLIGGPQQLPAPSAQPLEQPPPPLLPTTENRTGTCACTAKNTTMKMVLAGLAGKSGAGCKPSPDGL